MDNTFRDLVSQIFSNDAFTEWCYIQGRQTKCIQSSITNNVLYTEAGLSNDANFTLDLEIATLDRIPEEGDKVEYRGKFYKIASTETDSANASMKLYLIALSKGA